VQVSSYWSYYPQVQTEMNESHPRSGGPPWVRYRREAEDVLYEAGAAILDLPDFYGPHVHVSTLQNALNEAAFGKTINWLGRADVQREYVYVPSKRPKSLDYGEFIVGVRLNFCRDKYRSALSANQRGSRSPVCAVSTMYLARIIPAASAYSSALWGALLACTRRHASSKASSRILSQEIELFSVPTCSSIRIYHFNHVRRDCSRHLQNCSFDHLVSAQQKGFGDFQPECLGSL
jgi:hypothetical protein